MSNSKPHSSPNKPCLSLTCAPFVSSEDKYLKPDARTGRALGEPLVQLAHFRGPEKRRNLLEVTQPVYGPARTGPSVDRLSGQRSPSHCPTSPQNLAGGPFSFWTHVPPSPSVRHRKYGDDPMQTTGEISCLGWTGIGSGPQVRHCWSYTKGGVGG